MRSVLSIGFFILLLGFSNTTFPSPRTDFQPWIGRSAKQMINQRGVPDEKILYSNGSAYYVYNITTSTSGPTPRSPAIGVNVSQQGRPVMIVQAPEDQVKSLSLVCTVTVWVSSAGVIKNISFTGHC